MTPLVLWIPGNPAVKKRPRFANGRAITDAVTRQAEEDFRWRLRVARVKPFEGDLKVEMHFHRQDNRRCDIDNLVKLAWDAMNGFVWKDDSQVLEVRAVLERGSDEAGTWLKISPIESAA